MPITKSCEQCARHYPAKRQSSRFCCVSCRNANDRTAERRTAQCPACGECFEARKDHGRWAKFCSRACYSSECTKPTDKPCATCGAIFTATKAHHSSEDGLRKYCSKTCQIEGRKKRLDLVCLQCSKPFQRVPSAMSDRDAGCCSRECADLHYVGARSRGFKGGVHVTTQRGERHLLLPRPDRVGRYIGEHRVVATRLIGRLLTADEFVLRLNRVVNDNRPENLFVCSNSEFGRMRQGSMPWPSTSNLWTYR
jgi:hypothetical protein